jgi:hypothetical protein
MHLCPGHAHPPTLFFFAFQCLNSKKMAEPLASLLKGVCSKSRRNRDYKAHLLGPRCCLCRHQLPLLQDDSVSQTSVAYLDVDCILKECVLVSDRLGNRGLLQVCSPATIRKLGRP